MKVKCIECKDTVTTRKVVDRENYVCQVCVARVLKRLDRARLYENARRLPHGER